MKKFSRTCLSDRILPHYTKGEELFNMISHIVGGGVGVAALVLCVVFAALNHSAIGVVASAIYGTTMIVLYTMSSIYHGLKPDLFAKKVFQVIDHCSIFILIAGTYTPIALCGLLPQNAALGWSVFGIIWFGAALGITLNAIDIARYKKFSMLCYLAMGWCVVFAAKPTWNALGLGGTILLVAGGIMYSIGAALYAAGKHKRYLHSVFHLFVVAASVLHFLAIFFFIIL